MAPLSYRPRSPTTTRMRCAAPRWADQRANALLLDAAAVAAIDTDDERRG